MKKHLLYTTLTVIAAISSTCLALAQTAGGPNPVITEIMYNSPESGNDSLEFVEVYNPGLNAIGMDGFFFASGFSFTFPSDFVLGAGEYVIIAGDSVIFEAAFGVEALQWDGATTQLSNNGEGISLRHPSLGLIDTVGYDDIAPWPTSANGQGYSLVLCDPSTDNNVGTNWSVSQNNTGVIVNSVAVYADPAQAAVCSTVGIADDNVITTLLYPNPTEGEFRMQYAATEKAGAFDVFNSAGQLVYSQVIPAGSTSIIVDSKLQSGLYLIRFMAGDKTEQHRLIIQ
ncbi:MAG: lamin tail domain-containing protein [Flavobacteriales bacterium]|nr:lamin tail domain-containing protein [Flavobacteriales bacterium]